MAGLHPAVSGPRQRSLDVARGVGMGLVVLGHNWWLNHAEGEAFRVVYSFHMPLFFFLAGIFLKDGQGGAAFAAGKARALLQPWGVTLVLGAVVVELTQPGQLGLFVRRVVYASGASMPNPWGALWFLPHLFLAMLAAWGLRRVLPPRWQAWPGGGVSLAVLLGIGVAMLLTLHGRAAAPWMSAESWLHLDAAPGLPLSLDALGISTAFVLAGALCARAVRHLAFHRGAWWLALGVVTAAHALWQATMDLSLGRYDLPLVTTLEAALGIYLVLAASVEIARVPVLGPALAYLGEGSLFVLLFHVVFQSRLTGAILARWPDQTALGPALGLAAGVGLPLLIWEAVRRTRWLADLFHQRVRVVSSSFR